MTETIKLEDMFQTEEDKLSRIFIEGHPGFGKTTLLLKFLSDWSRREYYVSSRFCLVFLILLRSFQGRLQIHFLQQCHNKLNTEEESAQLIKFIEGKVLLLLDGWDEATEDTKKILMPLLKGQIYQNATVVVTSRTGFYHWFEKNDGILKDLGRGRYKVLNDWEKRIQVKGISREKRIEFLQKYLEIHPNELYSKTDNLPVRFSDFYCCPLFLLLLGVLAKENNFEEIGTKTQVYKAIFNFVVNRSLVKNEKLEKHVNIDVFDPGNRISSEYRDVVIGFGRICLKKIKFQILSFKESEIFVKESNVYDMGFLTKVVLFVEHQDEAEFEPIHKSFLEFLAAFYLSTIDETDLAEEIKELFKEGIKPTEDQLIYQFLAGLLGSDTIKLFRSLLPFKDFIRLLDVKRDFRCTLAILLNEIINPCYEIFNILSQFIPRYLIDCDDVEVDFPSTEFLRTWIVPVVNLSSQIYVLKEFRLNEKSSSIVNFLMDCFNRTGSPFPVKNMIFKTNKIESLASLIGQFKCQKLVIKYAGEMIPESLPSILEMLFKFCSSEMLFLEFDFPEITEKVKTWAERFREFCMSLTKGRLKNVYIHHLSILRICPNDLHSISSSIVDLIKAQKVTFGIKFSFQRYNPLKIYEFFFRQDIVNVIVNSHIQSFTFHVNQAGDPIDFPSVVFRRQRPWKYLELRGGDFRKKYFDYIKCTSIDHFSYVDFNYRKNSLFPRLLVNCNKIKKLTCYDVQRIQVETLGNWKGFVTIETLELDAQIIDDRFPSLVSRFRNLKKLKINNLRLPWDDCKRARELIIDVLVQTLSSLPLLNTFSIRSNKANVLYELLQRLSRLTDEEKRKIRLQKLDLNSARVNPFPMNEVIEEYKWLTRNTGMLEKFKARQQEQYKEEFRASMKVWLKIDTLVDDLIDHLESKDITPEGEETQSRSIKMTHLFGGDPRRILVEGTSRVVNNIFCCKLLREWATGKEYVARKFSLMFRFDVNDFNNDASVEELLIKKFPGKEMTSKDDIIAYINKYQHRILLILEGFCGDETCEETKRRVEPLLRRRLFPKMHVIVTCNDTDSRASKRHLTLGFKQAHVHDKKVKSCFNRNVFIKMFDASSKWDMITGLKDTLDSISDNDTTTIFDGPLFVASMHVMRQSVEERKLRRKTVIYKDYFNYLISILLNTDKEVDVFTLAQPNMYFSHEHKYLQTLDRFGKYTQQKVIKRESVSMDEEELLLISGDKSILRLGFLLKTNELYKPIDESFIEFAAAFSTVNVLRKLGEEAFKTELERIVMREGLRPTSDDSLFFPFLGGLLNDRATLLFDTLLPLSDWFDLKNVSFTNILMEIVDIHPFFDSFRHLLPSLFPPVYSTPRDLTSIDKKFLSSPAFSFLFNSAVKWNIIQILRWKVPYRIPLETNVTIGHLFLYLDGDYQAHYRDTNLLSRWCDYRGGVNLLKCQTLSLRFSGSFNVDHWSDVVRFLELIKIKIISFEFYFGSKDLNSSLLNCLHRELRVGKWREMSIHRVILRITEYDDPKCLRKLIEHVKTKNIKQGVYVRIDKTDQEEELKIGMKSDLQELFESVVQYTNICDFYISNGDSSFSPVFDFSRLHRENVSFDSLYLFGTLNILNGNVCAKLSVREALILCSGGGKKNSQLIQNLQGIKWLWCSASCFDCLVEDKWHHLNKLDELTLTVDQSLRVNPSISDLTQLRILTLNFCDAKEIPSGSELCFHRLFSSLSLRTLQLIYIPRDISSFDWLVDCVVKGLEGRKENSNSKAIPLLHELHVSFNDKESSHSTFDWNNLKGSIGMKAIHCMLQSKRIRQFSWVDLNEDIPRDIPRSLFPLDDQFTIKLHIHGSGPSHSRHNQWKYRWLDVHNEYCITSTKY